MTIGTKVESETHEKLTKLAESRGVSVSELVRALIEAGISDQNKTATTAIPADLSERLDALEKQARKATRAAAKAQFLATIAVNFTSQTARVVVSGLAPTTEEQTTYMDQTNEWAEGFAQKYLQEDNSSLLSSCPHPCP
jgi:predicted DNA-binding protein